MKRDTSRPRPRPSESLLLKVYEQSPLPVPGWQRDERSDELLEATLDRGILSATHAYGIHVEKSELLYFGENVYVKLRGSAGEFTFEKTWGASRYKHPVASICNKILKFLRAHEEEIG